MRATFRTAAYLAIALAVAILAGCAGHVPEPEVRTVEVMMPVDDPACARAAVAKLGPIRDELTRLEGLIDEAIRRKQGTKKDTERRTYGGKEDRGSG